MSGSVNPNGAFTSYTYEFGTTINLDNKSSTQTIGSGFEFISAPAYITGLTKNTTYYYRLVAQNRFGIETSPLRNFTTTQGTPAPIGSAPNIKSITANNISRTTANINAEINPNKNATSYWFEYGTSQNLGNTTPFIFVGEGNINISVSQSVSNLTPATNYYFRVNAQNSFGTVNGAIKSFQTSGPISVTAPSTQTMSANSINNTSANLRGNINPNGNETTYWFEYSNETLFSVLFTKNTDPEKLSGNLNSTNVDTNITGLTPKTNYYYRLVAQNSSGTVRGEKMSFKTK
jgi:phosphodiesterase/alkaline phosphatase D-like protein